MKSGAYDKLKEIDSNINNEMNKFVENYCASEDDYEYVKIAEEIINFCNEEFKKFRGTAYERS